MALVKRKTKQGTSWGVVVYDPATGKQKWLGTRATQSEAKRLEASSVPDASPSLRSLADEWLASRNVRKSTLDNYTRALDAACELLGEREVRQITSRDADALMAHLSRYQPLTANVYVGVFLHLMRDAHRYGLVDKMPSVGNKPKRERTRKIRPVTVAEHRLLTACTPEHYRRLIAVMPLVGLRSAELRGLQRDDIQADGLHVERLLNRQGQLAPLKTATSRRVVPLTPEARTLLEAQAIATPSPRLFVTPQGFALHSSTFYKEAWYPAREAAGIAVNAHDMRHTFAAWHLQAGTNVKVLQRMMGHANVQTTLNLYGHLMPESLDAAAALLSAFVSASEEAAG